MKGDAVWNIALSAKDIAALAAGVPAKFVRPEHIVWIEEK